MVANKRVSREKETRETQQCEHPTPKRVRVQSITQFVQEFDLPVTQRQIFTFCGIGHTQGYELLKNDSSERRVANRPENQWDLHENKTCQPRGRKRKVSEADLQRVENIIEIGGIDHHTCRQWVVAY
jgi:hypothetical protein